MIDYFLSEDRDLKRGPNYPVDNNSLSISITVPGNCILI